jgi:hypothetical protein
MRKVEGGNVRIRRHCHASSHARHPWGDSARGP